MAEEETYAAEKAPKRFGSKEFTDKGPISIAGADGNRYQLDAATDEYFQEIERALKEKTMEQRRNNSDSNNGNNNSDKNDREEEEKREELEQLANNALEGAEGKECELMMDARCSRVIEKLCEYASDENFSLFVRRVCTGWKSYVLAMNIFGSRVLESVIREISKRLDAEKRSEKDVLRFKDMLLEKVDVDDGFARTYDDDDDDNDDGNNNNDGNNNEQNKQKQQQQQRPSVPEPGPRSCLDNLSYVMSAKAKDVAFDQRASPVARRVFFLFAGKDMPLNPGGRDKSLAAGQQNYKPQGNLESKLKGATTIEKFNPKQKQNTEDRINAFPEILESHTNDVLANVEEVLWDMTEDPCASAYLQAILLSQEGNEASLKWIIPGLLGCAPPEDAPDGELLEELSSDDIKTLMQSRSGSHLLEVIVKVAPRKLSAEIWRRFFRDKLMSISKHPVANFVLQSVLGSSNDPSVIASAVSELSTLFGTLLYENRAGVIAALLAACLRLNTNEKDCCKALARGVTFKLEKKNKEDGGRVGGKSQLARALLFLGNPPHGRCSVLGAAMMQTLAKFPADATIMFCESLCDTDSKSLLQASRDASGSHAIEAILNSRVVKTKHKKAISEALIEHSVALAVSSGGSRVLEACYRETDGRSKKRIVSLCSTREKEICATRHGAVLFKRLGVKQFQSNASGWEKREEKAAHMRSEFEKEFGEVREVPPPPSSSSKPATGNNDTNKRKKDKDDEDDEDVKEQKKAKLTNPKDDDDDDDEEKRKRKKKKSKKKENKPDNKEKKEKNEKKEKK